MQSLKAAVGRSKRHSKLSRSRNSLGPSARLGPGRALPVSFFSQTPWTSFRGLKGAKPGLSIPHSPVRRFSSMQNPLPDRYVGSAVLALIGINTAVFAAWQYADYTKNANLKRKLVQNTTLTAANIREGRYYTMVTAAFSHQNFMHFLFNMFALNAFGQILSFVPGVRWFHVLSLAVGSGISGSGAWLYHRMSKDTPSQTVKWNPFTQRQEWTVHIGLGASGMVMGLGAAATCLMPMAPMSLFFIPIAVPLFVITGGYFAIDAYYLDRGDRIGHAAHLGGSAYGAIFYLAYLRRFGGVWQMARRMVRR